MVATVLTSFQQNWILPLSEFILIILRSGAIELVVTRVTVIFFGMIRRKSKKTPF